MIFNIALSLEIAWVLVEILLNVVVIVFPVEIDPSTVLHLNLNRYLDEYFVKYSVELGDDYIVQLESEVTNIAANLYHLNNNSLSQTFAVDHFTGG